MRQRHSLTYRAWELVALRRMWHRLPRAQARPPWGSMKPVSTVWQRDEDGILQPVSTRIDFGDYARMGTERHVARRHARWTPAFAANDVQLRKVIAQRL